MLRTILILTVIGLSTILYASNTKAKRYNDLNKGLVKSNVQCLMTQSALPLEEVVLCSDETENIVVYEIEEVTISAKRLNNKGVTDNLKDRSHKDVVYEIEEVTISAKRLNDQYLSAR